RADRSWSSEVCSSDLTTTAKINPKPVTASIAASDKEYDGSDLATITSCSISGKVGSDDVGCSTSNPKFASANANASPQTVTATEIGRASWRDSDRLGA